MTETAADRRNPDSRKRKGSYSLDHLTWPEVERALARDSRLILPVGALEQYGPHLPLGVNTLIAETLARDLSRETGVLLAPTLWCGVKTPTRDVYAGSAGLRRKTLHRVVNELLAAWEDHGVTDFLVITAHRYEPHLDALLMAFTASACSTIINIYSIEVDDLLEGPPEGEHGGELETSLLLHLAPDRVRTELIADFIPDPRTFRRYVRGRVPTPPPGSRGTVGRPTLATREKGEVIYRRYLRTVLSSLNAGDAPPSPTGPTEEGEG